MDERLAPTRDPGKVDWVVMGGANPTARSPQIPPSLVTIDARKLAWQEMYEKSLEALTCAGHILLVSPA